VIRDSIEDPIEELIKEVLQIARGREVNWQFIFKKQLHGVKVLAVGEQREEEEQWSRHSTLSTKARVLLKLLIRAPLAES
jgi:hypothetical protein